VPLCAVARPRGGRLVLWLHGSWSDVLLSPGRPLFKAMSRFVSTRSDLLLVMSKEELREWRQFEPRARVALVSNVIVEPVPDALGLVQERLTARGVVRLLFVGRLVPEKGILDLVDAVERLSSGANGGFELTVAGTGPLQGEIARRVAETARLSSRVRIAGYLEAEALRREYARADVFVLPSWREGLPHSMVEAMSFGLPTVATGIRGMRDHIEHGVTGLLVCPHDPAALASALSTLIVSREVRAAMGLAAHLSASAFDPAVVSQGYLGAIDNLTEPEFEAE
jgi:glycosyltransferase involved in cell wall biosynthesis